MLQEVLQKLIDARWGTVIPNAYSVPDAFLVYQNEWADPLVVWCDQVMDAIDVDEWLYQEFEWEVQAQETQVEDYDAWVTAKMQDSDFKYTVEDIFEDMISLGASKPITDYEYLEEHSLIAAARKKAAAA